MPERFDLPMPDGITIKADISQVTAAIRDLAENQAPYVLAVALTRTAQQIQRVEQNLMGEVFDRPTPFTLNSLYVKPATKADPVAVVEFKEGFGSVPAWRYLGPEVRGGDRHKKSHELALERAGILKPDEYVAPGPGANLDSYGNMRGGDITRILSQLKASNDPTQNATDSRRSKRSRARLRYFVMRDRGVADGVYLSRGGRSILQVLRFIPAPSYSERFPFYETGREVFGYAFIANARAAWASVVESVNRAARLR